MLSSRIPFLMGIKCIKFSLSNSRFRSMFSYQQFSIKQLKCTSKTISFFMTTKDASNIACYGWFFRKYYWFLQIVHPLFCKFILMSHERLARFYERFLVDYQRIYVDYRRFLVDYQRLARFYERISYNQTISSKTGGWRILQPPLPFTFIQLI